MIRQSLYFTNPYTLALQEEHLPQPGMNEVLVQTLVSAISPGTEMLIYRGQMPQDLAIDETISALDGTFTYPLKYGYAAVGKVIAIGANVTTAWHDRLVFAFNPHESHFVAPVDALIPLPPGLTAETGVFLPNMETAVSFLMDGQPLIGEQIAVCGQGIVGLLTTALLAQFPLSRLITADYYPLRREWSQTLGAHASLHPEDRHILSRLQGDSDYAGADLTYELSGNPAALDLAIDITGYNGRILIGSWYGRKQATLNLGGRFHRSHMRLISSQVSHLAPQWLGRWGKGRRLQVAWQMLAALHPEQLITHRFPITKANAAYHLLNEHPEQAIQVLLTYNP